MPRSARKRRAERIGRVGSPVLGMHGSEDQLIPPELGRGPYREAVEALFGLKPPASE